MGRPKPIDPREIKKSAWNTWRETLTRKDIYFMEYWRTSHGTWFINFPNMGWGHQLLTREDRAVANTWEPKDIYNHLTSTYSWSE